MGRRGPAPKPSGVRIIEGTDRKGHSGRFLDRAGEPIAPVGQMERPYEMSEAVGAIWDFTIAQLEAMGIGSPADARQIAVYCEAVWRHEWASQRLAELGTPLQRSNSPDRFMISKLVLIQERAARDILRFGQEFGLTPASRTRVDVSSPLLRPKRSGYNPFDGSNTRQAPS